MGGDHTQNRTYLYTGYQYHPSLTESWQPDLPILQYWKSLLCAIRPVQLERSTQLLTSGVLAKLPSWITLQWPSQLTSPHHPMCLELTFSPMLLKMIKLPGVIKHLRKASNMKEKKNSWRGNKLRGNRLCRIKASRKMLSSERYTNYESRVGY